MASSGRDVAGSAVMSGTAVTRERQTVPTDAPGLDVLAAHGWVVVVWNDPINLMTYVTYVFRKLFGYSLPKAHGLMLQVHTEGRAVVSGGTKERCEHDASRLHAHGLWATITPE
jgi:ATP-dependent Clp protease adaptor protein ClpS